MNGDRYFPAHSAIIPKGNVNGSENLFILQDDPIYLSLMVSTDSYLRDVVGFGTLRTQLLLELFSQARCPMSPAPSHF
jgi:hypothetical protein